MERAFEEIQNEDDDDDAEYAGDKGDGPSFLGGPIEQVPPYDQTVTIPDKSGRNSRLETTFP